MRLFLYYSLHTFKNQLKKLFKTWILIFILICAVVGGIFGGVIASVSPDTEEEPEESVEEPSFFEEQGVSAADVVELAAGGAALLVFVFFAVNADKNGSRIFLPADVNLLFSSPMKPQSVLMFRLATQMGAGLIGIVYMLFQVPNLVLNMGLTLWAGLSLALAWGLIMTVGALLQVTLYTLSATYPSVKRNLRRCIYALVILIALAFAIYASRSSGGVLLAAVSFFNARFTRLIPFWGWIKGLCGCAAEGSLPGAAAYLLALCLGGAALTWGIWRLKADFYEDAMAKSEETAELLAAAQSESTTGARRKKDRSEKLLRDGLSRGFGANIYFHKTLYNRRRFARFGFLTKTMTTYLAASVVVGGLCRIMELQSSAPLALTLGVFVFFRAMGDPLGQDTSNNLFLLTPESTWAKLFWSLLGGTVSCLLDILPPIIIGALIAGSNPLAALLWVPIIVSVDFYATTVESFIALSVPVSAGKLLKQLVMILFVYFGLIPDIIIAVIGISMGRTAIAMVCAAAVNIALGLVFFALTPLFMGPYGGRPIPSPTSGQADPRAARRCYSRTGTGLFVMLTLATILQIAAAIIAGRFWPIVAPDYVLWLETFVPLYLIAIPVGLLILRPLPVSRPESRPLRPLELISCALICIFLLHAGNVIGNLTLELVRAALGHTAENPISSYTSEPVIYRALFLAVLAPVIEEFIFRRQLIDRMGVYGPKRAVVLSALLFGLFHGNLSQFFYAFALGLVFGYIYLKTGRLRYSIGLHMLVNLMGGVVAPYLSDLSSDLPFMIYFGVVIALSLAGLVLLIIRARDTSFPPPELEIPPKKRLSCAFLNPGMLLFLAASLGSIVLTFVV